MPRSTLRVLHVIERMTVRAGAEVSLLELVRSTSDRIEHGICSLHPEPVRHHPAGVTRTFVPTRPLTRRQQLDHVRAAVRAFDPSLVHTSVAWADVIGRLAAWRERRPVLVSLVNTPYEPAALVDSGVRPLKLRGFQLLDASLSRRRRVSFHAITEAVKASAVAHLRIAPERITVVPRVRSAARLGRRKDERRQRCRRALGLPPSAPVVLCVGREEPQKGHTDLLQAAELLRRQVPDLVVMMAGRPGNRSPAIDEQIARSGLEACVRRIGVRDDIPELQCAADVFAFPSLYEGFGGAMLEAMALETPVVATDTPAVAEVLGDGGQLVPPKDPPALAEALATALHHEGGVDERVRCGRSRFEAHFELEPVGDAMVQLWQQAAQR
jgi:glycosyltransferase involved in cell wall biosynthesis